MTVKFAKHSAEIRSLHALEYQVPTAAVEYRWIATEVCVGTCGLCHRITEQIVG